MDAEEQTKAHVAALEETGFWGRQGAGCIVMARSTGRILVGFRSEEVVEPFTWGCWGGAIDDGESPVEAALREVREECGYPGGASAEPLLVFRSGSFRYSNFLVTVDEEFHPSLNRETSDAGWFELDHLPSPLHFGLEALFADRASMETIREAASHAAAPRPRGP